jgi:hypothetical protein
MARKKAWLPRNHNSLYLQARKTKEYLALNNNQIRVGLDPVSTLGMWYQNVFLPLFDAFITAYLNWENTSTRTTDISQLLEAAEQAFIPVYTQLYKGVLRDGPLVTNADLDNMGLPTRTSGPYAKHNPPTTFVESRAELLGQGVFNLHYRDAGAETSAKPFGVHGAELISKISDTPVAYHSELGNSQFDTDTPFHFSFPSELRGKTFYYALRWENTTGEKGPWSAIASIVIP